jgi:hypothetical protein
VPVADLRFFYEGWNLVAEFDANGQPVQTYLWGADLT